MSTMIVAQPFVNPTPTEAVMNTISVPSGMQMNPWFDWAPVMGIPMWVYVTIGFVFLLLYVNLRWIFRMRRLAAVKGYVEAEKKATQKDMQTWIIGKTKKLTIECLKYVDSVLSYYDIWEITRWHHNTQFSVMHVGGVPALLVSDDFDQTRDIVSEIALCHGCEMHNKLNPDKQITCYTDYETFGHNALMALYPEGLKIPSYSIFDPGKFRKYFPKGCSAGFFGGEFLRDSRKLKHRYKEPSFWDKHFPAILAVIMGMIAIMAAWMVPL